MKRKSTILIVVLILMLAIGFAAVATTIIIGSSSSVGQNSTDFDVYFSSASTDEGGTATINQSTKREITFGTKTLKSPGDVATLNYTVTNNSSQYDADVSVTFSATNTVDNTDYTSYYSVTRTGFDTTAHTVVAGKTSVDGTVVITLLKPVTSNVQISFTLTLNVNATERTSVATTQAASPQYTVISGDINTVGSEIALGDEHFYVLGQQDSTHVKLLSKYKLDENNRQSENNYVEVQFAPEQFFSNTSLNTLTYYNEALALNSPPDDPEEPYTPIYNSAPLFDIYNNSLPIATRVNAYVTYLTGLGYTVTGRLLSIGADVTTSDVLHGYCEGNDGCGYFGADSTHISSTISDIVVGPNDYWTGTAYDIYGNIMIISSRDNGDYAAYGSYNDMGVRPVIILQK